MLALEDDSGGEEEQEQEEKEEEAGGGRGAVSLMDIDSEAAGPSWGGLQLEDDQEQEAGSDDEDGAGKKLSKAAKKRAKKEKEAQIRAAEMARLSGDSAPQSAADFERLLVSSPNSSFVWIKFMAWHISQGDTDKAREVAERALATIFYREEQEKFNVWVAWLNLENAYGSPNPEEAAMKLLQRALQYNEPKKMYLAALGIFERSGRTQASDQLLKTLTKKYGGSAKVWLRQLEVLLQRGGAEG
eukprot:CAMPEP_0202909786 /NCGR_PEP_ID=MMETSP1392-20130828/50287_1 /ASSEMBLY_ACC=CAM_ASM_000868 /TAXON_ID=225041 /ORGANISM="Chlamydomonas chlamydogama, Strain SAG 11-48b" /LENGTH=243 /DNA_ID=CAMNT_0049599651 /DNA_START=1 /DNA_END=728 /DNA_ORIENTATION=-